MNTEFNINRFKFVQWDITSKCNLNCIHCRSKSFYGSNNLKKDQTTSEVFKTLDELYNHGVRRIHILGGEPFTRSDITDIAKYAFKKGIVISINTNGTLISSEIADKILDASIYLITFSLDGPTAEINDKIRGKGVFNKVVNAIKMLDNLRKSKQKHLRMIVTPVVMRSNIDYLHRMLDIATELNLDNIIYTNLRRMGGAIQFYNKMKVSTLECIRLIEKAINHSKQVRNKYGRCVHIQPGIVGNPILLYINKKYNTNYSIDPGGCTAGYSKGFLQPDGALFPCQDLAKYALEINRRNEAEQSGTKSWMDRKDVEELKTKMFSRKTYNKYKPCSKCPLLLVFCRPCPIAGLNNRGIYKKECEIELNYARNNGIDVQQEVNKRLVYSIQDRLVKDPSFRYLFIKNDMTIFNEYDLNQQQYEEIQIIRDQLLNDVIKAINYCT